MNERTIKVCGIRNDIQINSFKRGVNMKCIDNNNNKEHTNWIIFCNPANFISVQLRTKKF